jgi:hypothetical protein
LTHPPILPRTNVFEIRFKVTLEIIWKSALTLLAMGLGDTTIRFDFNRFSHESRMREFVAKPPENKCFERKYYDSRGRTDCADESFHLTCSTAIGNHSMDAGREKFSDK